MGCEDWKERKLFAASETASNGQSEQELSGPSKKRVDAAYSEPQCHIGSYVAADVDVTYIVGAVFQRAGEVPATSRGKT